MSAAPTTAPAPSAPPAPKQASPAVPKRQPGAGRAETQIQSRLVSQAKFQDSIFLNKNKPKGLVKGLAKGLDGAARPNRVNRQTAPATGIPESPLKVRPELEQQEQGDADAETAEFEDDQQAPSNYEKLFGAPVPRNEAINTMKDASGGFLGFSPTISLKRNVRGQGNGQEGESLQDQVADALDETGALGRGEFDALFWGSLIDPFLPLILLGWFIYWAVTKFKRVPKAIQLSAIQKISLVLIALLLFVLVILFIYIIMDYLCTGASGFLVKFAVRITHPLTASDVGVTEACKQFNDVFSSLGK